MAFSTSFEKKLHFSKETMSILSSNLIGASGVVPYVLAKHFIGSQEMFANPVSSLAGLTTYPTIIAFVVAAVAYAVSIYGIEKHGGVSNTDLAISVAGTVSLVAGLLNMIFDPPISLAGFSPSIKTTSKMSTQSLSSKLTAVPQTEEKPAVGFSIN